MKLNRLLYKNKVAFVARQMPDIKFFYCIPDSLKPNEYVMDLCKYKGKFTGKRWIDDFDYVEFLNKQKCKEENSDE